MTWAALGIWESNGLARAKAWRSNNFWCVSQMSTLFSCVRRKDVTVFKGRASGRGARGSPPKAKILSFWTCNRSRKFACLLIFESAQKSQILYLCCPAKMTFNKSHFGMCIVPRGHFITIRIFPEGQRGEGQGHEGQLLPIFLWRRP